MTTVTAEPSDIQNLFVVLVKEAVEAVETKLRLKALRNRKRDGPI
jgi:hypothetical protein